MKIKMRMKIKMNRFALIIILPISGCTSLTKVDVPPSEITLPAQYEQTSQNMNSDNINQWWRTWHDAQLTRLIEQGLQQNGDINIAKSRFDQAQAMIKAVNADLSPSVAVSAIAGVNDSKLSSDGSYQLNNEGIGKVLGGGLTATWVPDIWGQKQSDIDATIAQASATKMRIYGAQMALASAVGNNYLRAEDNLVQQTLLKDTLATLTELRRYVKGRFNAGDASAYDVQAVEAQIQALTAQQTTLNTQFATYERAIAVLIGQVPQGFRLDKNAMTQSHILQQLPQPPRGEQPQNLLNKRPDLMMAAANVEVQVAKLASAKADFLPRFDLRFLWQTGRLEIGSNVLSGIDGWGSLASFAVQLPIFTAGKIQANVDAQNAALKTALLAYDQSLLQALAEVDNRYQRQFALQRQNQALAQTITKSQQREISAQKLFQYGDKTLDSVLNVQLQTLQYQQDLAQSRLASGLNLIALYQAIGRGWE